MKTTGPTRHRAIHHDVQTADALLSIFLFILTVFFAARPEYSVVGEVLRIVVSMMAMAASLGASMGMTETNVFVLNVFLCLFFFFLFVVTSAVRLFGAGDWFINEIFEVTLLDVFITGILGVAYFGNVLRGQAALLKKELGA